MICEECRIIALGFPDHGVFGGLYREPVITSGNAGGALTILQGEWLAVEPCSFDAGKNEGFCGWFRGVESRGGIGFVRAVFRAEVAIDKSHGRNGGFRRSLRSRCVGMEVPYAGDIADAGIKWTRAADLAEERIEVALGLGIQSIRKTHGHEAADVFFFHDVRLQHGQFGTRCRADYEMGTDKLLKFFLPSE